MDSHNLQTASIYVNNMLLSRGLLRNSKPIDFAHLGNESEEAEETTARVINLVHDLIMRRDREAEHRENIAATIRELRTAEAKHASEIERFESKTEELTRALVVAESQERSFKTTIRNAETTIRGLKEQGQRMKVSVQQIRSQCANDIRKRDLELQRLKQHLTERQRGKRDGFGINVIHITPAPRQTQDSKIIQGGEGIDDPGYSLDQETTEFLTRLCQELSNENDAMIAMVKSAIQTLRSLQGLPDVSTIDESKDSSNDGSIEPNSSIRPPEAQYERLSHELAEVLEHLEELLTNPSFVSLEEVEIRDNEIFRLREGWEKMEVRWKQAVKMMDAWQMKMAGKDLFNDNERQTNTEQDSMVGEAKESSHCTNEKDSAISISEDQLHAERVDETVEPPKQPLAQPPKQIRAVKKSPDNFRHESSKTPPEENTENQNPVKSSLKPATTKRNDPKVLKQGKAAVKQVRIKDREATVKDKRRDSKKRSISSRRGKENSKRRRSSLSLDESDIKDES